MVPIPRAARISTPSRMRMTVAISAAAIPGSIGFPRARFVRVDSHPSLPGLTRQSIFLRRKRWTRGSSPRVTVSTRGPISPESALILDFTKPDRIHERLALGEPLHEIHKPLQHANRDQNPADRDGRGRNRNRKVGALHTLVVFEVTEDLRKRVI